MENKRIEKGYMMHVKLTSARLANITSDKIGFIEKINKNQNYILPMEQQINSYYNSDIIWPNLALKLTK